MKPFHALPIATYISGRFANYSALIYAGFVENYPAIVTALTEVQVNLTKSCTWNNKVQEEGMATGASDNQKKKADKCAGIQVCFVSV